VLHCCLRSVYRYKTVHIFLSLVPVSENVTEYKMCVLSFSANFSINFLILKITQRDIIIYVQYIGPYATCRLFLLDFNIC